jgi:hypothetical protein
MSHTTVGSATPADFAGLAGASANRPSASCIPVMPVGVGFTTMLVSASRRRSA